MSVEFLYLDLATRTGYAAGGLRGVEGFGVFDLPATYENIGRYLNIADKRIEALVNRFDPAEIAFESPFINRRVDTIIKVRKLSGLANVVEQIADRHEKTCQEALGDDVMRHYLGRNYPRYHDGKKAACKVKCRELGHDVTDDNDADALAGLSYMLACKHPQSALKGLPLAPYLLPAA